MEDFYEILEIPHTASKAEIKKAYRELAKKYHPDKNANGKAEERFKKISEAYSVLSDSRKKQEYDSGFYYGRQESERSFRQSGSRWDYDGYSYTAYEEEPFVYWTYKKSPRGKTSNQNESASSSIFKGSISVLAGFFFIGRVGLIGFILSLYLISKGFSRIMTGISSILKSR